MFLFRIRKFLPTLILFPCLYLIGWIIVQPLNLFGFNFSNEKLSLLGTIVTFILFLFVLPGWVRHRWKNPSFLKALGVFPLLRFNSLALFLKGFSFAILLIALLLIVLTANSYIEDFNSVKISNVINSILLIFGVGFTEELIFRGWLWGELNYLFGREKSFIFQAFIFSIAHIRFGYEWSHLLPLLIGLFLLGLLLGLMRNSGKGSLWGCIGLHGGLVGGWFLIDSGIIKFSSNISPVLIGPGVQSPNPIGGVISILTLSLILYYYRNEFDNIGRFFGATSKASSNEDIP